MMNKTSTTINSRCWGDLSFQSARVKHRNTACSFFQVELMEPRNLLFAVNSRIGALCLCFSRPPSECTQGLEAFSRYFFKGRFTCEYLIYFTTSDSSNFSSLLTPVMGSGAFSLELLITLITAAG